MLQTLEPRQLLSRISGDRADPARCYGGKLGPWRYFALELIRGPTTVLVEFPSLITKTDKRRHDVIHRVHAAVAKRCFNLGLKYVKSAKVLFSHTAIVPIAIPSRKNEASTKHLVSRRSPAKRRPKKGEAIGHVMDFGLQKAEVRPAPVC
jgi:hypothetical protein